MKEKGPVARALNSPFFLCQIGSKLRRVLGLEPLFGLDDEIDRQLVLLGKCHTRFRPYHHQRGIEGVGLQRGRGDDAGGDQLVGDRLAGGGVDDMGVTLAIQLVVVAIAARGAERHAVGDDDIGKRSRLIGGFDDGHFPWRALAVVALAAHRTGHFDQVVVYPLPLEQGGDFIRCRPFAESGEVEIEIRDRFFEQEVIPLRGQGQLVDPHLVAGGGDGRLIGPLDRPFVRAKTPQIDQWPHGHIQLAVGQLTGINPLLDYDGHGGRDGKRDVGGPLIETGDERARIVGGDLLVHPGQQALYVAFEGGLSTGVAIAQGHHIVGAHGLALNTGLGRRGGLAAGQRQQQG